MVIFRRRMLSHASSSSGQPPTTMPRKAHPLNGRKIWCTDHQQRRIGIRPLEKDRHRAQRHEGDADPREPVEAMMVVVSAVVVMVMVVIMIMIMSVIGRMARAVV